MSRDLGYPYRGGGPVRSTGAIVWPACVGCCTRVQGLEVTVLGESEQGESWFPPLGCNVQSMEDDIYFLI